MLFGDSRIHLPSNWETFFDLFSNFMFFSVNLLNFLVKLTFFRDLRSKVNHAEITKKYLTINFFFRNWIDIWIMHKNSSPNYDCRVRFYLTGTFLIGFSSLAILPCVTLNYINYYFAKFINIWPWFPQYSHELTVNIPWKRGSTY